MAVLAGEIMLRSGAETYRVEDTIKHILDTAGESGGDRGDGSSGTGAGGTVNARANGTSPSRRAESAGAVRTESLVMLTGIIVTIERPGQEAVTVMRRVPDRGTKMHRIVEVNEISPEILCQGTVSRRDMGKTEKHKRQTIHCVDV